MWIKFKDKLPLFNRNIEVRQGSGKSYPARLVDDYYGQGRGMLVPVGAVLFTDFNYYDFEWYDE